MLSQHSLVLTFGGSVSCNITRENDYSLPIFRAMIVSHSQIGSHHTNHNEDALVYADLTGDHLLMAVMDGSSSGTDSHFAASLVGKTLRKIARHTNLRTFAERRAPTTEELLAAVMENLLQDLREINASLDLDQDELLTTLVLAVVDRRGAQADIVVIGDGLVACDEEIKEFSQPLSPDYLGHLLREEFSDWWSSQTQRVRCTDFLDLALSTDGILSFRPFSPDPYRPVSPDEITEFLLTTRDEGEPETMYRRKLIYIRNKFGLEPTDDLTVLRYLI